MLEHLTITNFRGFQKFEMGGLGRINLLVGTNNCGKTSVLEAIHILSAVGDILPILTILRRRGEQFSSDSSAVEADVCHLFHGHILEVHESIDIVGMDRGREQCVSVIAIDNPPREDPLLRGANPLLRGANALLRGADALLRGSDALLPPENNDARSDEEEEESAGLGLYIEWNRGSSIFVPLSERGGIPPAPRRRPEERRNIRFVTTASLNESEILTLFSDIVLKPEESFVIEALRTIEPGIERIAPLMNDRRPGPRERGGLVVKCAHFNERVPIGSMGDGIWRLLGLALCLVRSQNGILLVDEIDTGLHYSVLSDMWTLINKTAKRLNVQVFATTHSRDCYESLAAISRESVSEGSEVSIQRIERGSERAVAFTEQEIVIAAQRGVEVR